MSRSAGRAVFILICVAAAAAIAVAGVRHRPHFSSWIAYARSLRPEAAPTAAAFAKVKLETTATGGNELPWVYTQLWSKESPFRLTVAQQKSAGATSVEHRYVDALWSQGVADEPTADVVPIYTAQPSDPLLITACDGFKGNCNAKNVAVHVPTYAIAQQASDGHLTVIDEHAPSGRVELDCWRAVIAGSTLHCTWAGVYALGGSGLDAGGASIHAGMAVTTIFLTAQELLNGHIDHPLALNANCLNDPMLFPSTVASTTDKSCDGSSNPPHYGNLLHLLWSPQKIAASDYSEPCKVILTALAVYGAYLDDTGNSGLGFHVQNELSYTANPATRPRDPWPSIQSQLDAGGDGHGSSWYSCLNRVQAADFELLTIAQPK